MRVYLEEKGMVFSEVGSSDEGLSQQQAEQRLEQNGKNRIAEGKKTTLVERFLAQLKDPMIIILIVAAFVSGATAIYENESLADVFIILFVVILNAVLGVVQESKAEKAIEALKEMSASMSKVLRSGILTSIKSEDLVLGDIILLEAGDAVPADARVIESASLKIEEAALTGESVPVSKNPDALSLGADKDISLGDRKNMVYMGSTVSYGRGKAVVTGCGMNTEMGKIADAITNAQEGQTPLQIKLAQLSRVLTWMVLGICAFIFAFSLFRSSSITSEVVLHTFMISVSLAVAAIPEGLAAVVTIVLSIGVTKMAKRNAVIRRLTAVETLGCAQIICSDKTGTLTQNKMTVTEFFGDDEKLLATGMALCNDAELDEKNHAVGEPTECSLINYAFSVGLSKNDLKNAFPRTGEAPFDSMRKLMSTVHNNAGKLVQYTKGAPDEVLKICTHYYKDGKSIEMTDEQRKKILDENKRMADKALRVLACGYKFYENEPAEYSPAALENGLTFVGLTGMIDPVRPEVFNAIKECGAAGIRPIMITGDHKDTAVAIAIELGMITDASQAITGAQLNEISDEEFAKTIGNYSVYARVQPEHKVRIVNAWRANGMITAMTGDGVNDAPSIKSADIGIGMGITGTDVTKNVADMVLGDDNFATIVSAVEEGRKIYDNIRKAIQFLLASNLSEVVSIFVATILGFVILSPAHILWINLITDTFPAIALGMEKGEPDIMKRKPRSSKEGIFSGGLGVNVIWQGIMVSILTLASYFIGHYIESGRWEITASPDGMTMAFLTMSMAEIFHSLNMRSPDKSIFKLKTHNPYLYGAAGLSLLLTTLVIYVPFLSKLFKFEHISIMEYAIALGLAFAVIPIVEIVKACIRKSKEA